jgi:hypothetical protein
MSSRELAVLLVGESATGFSHIMERLRTGGCRCRFARSYEEAQGLVAKEAFDLVLTVLPSREHAITSLADALAEGKTSVFYCQRVEDTSWWLPILREGRRCFGAPALRPSEFAGALDAIVAEIRAQGSSEAAPGAEAPAAPKTRTKAAG